MASMDDLNSSPMALRLSDRQQVLLDAQEIIYDALLTGVKTQTAQEVLALFEDIFVKPRMDVEFAPFLAIQQIAFRNQEPVFISTIKRSCYILLNNWEISQNRQGIHNLVDLLGGHLPPLSVNAPSWKRRLHHWLCNFIASHHYQELVFFAQRFERGVSPLPKAQSTGEKPWVERYAYYFLIPQYENSENPQEQRSAARRMADKMRYRFKLDLAMYVAHSQHPNLSSSRATQLRPSFGSSQRDNPTGLGDETLRLIKLVVTRGGHFSHANIAHIFEGQVEGIDYFSYKQSLIKYLGFAMEQKALAKQLEHRIWAKLIYLYSDYDDRRVNSALKLRTCNQIARFLTTENKKQPSDLFTLLLTQGGALTLVLLLLKLVLISPKSRSYLDLQISYLAQYYQGFPPEECKWFTQFLDVLNVTFAIYLEGVHYSLIRPEDNATIATTSQISSGVRASIAPEPLTIPPPEEDDYPTANFLDTDFGSDWTDDEPTLTFAQASELDRYRLFSQASAEALQAKNVEDSLELETDFDMDLDTDLNTVLDS